MSYELVSVSPAADAEAFSVDPASGGIRVRKGLKLGTYQLKIKVRAAGNAYYKPAEETVTVQIKLYSN